MVLQFLLGAALIFLSVIVHVGFIAGAIKVLDIIDQWAMRPPKSLRTATIVGLAAIWLMLGHAIAIVLWAFAFKGLGVFSDYDTSIYFSAVAFTTLGFGDVVPPDAWRHLAGICAANGLLLFGVSSAVLVEVLRQVWEVQNVLRRRPPPNNRL